MRYALTCLLGRSHVAKGRTGNTCTAFCFTWLRGPESNRRLEVLLHLLFPAGMDYPIIL